MLFTIKINGIILRELTYNKTDDSVYLNTSDFKVGVIEIGNDLNIAFRVFDKVMLGDNPNNYSLAEYLSIKYNNREFTKYEVDSDSLSISMWLCALGNILTPYDVYELSDTLEDEEYIRVFFTSIEGNPETEFYGSTVNIGSFIIRYNNSEVKLSLKDYFKVITLNKNIVDYIKSNVKEK